jgi:beta-lactamase regulating signal transducer with metallopeptidase domain
MNALVIGLIVKTSLLIGTAFAVNMLVLRKRSAASRHLVWTLSLGAILLLPVLSATVPTLSIPIRVAATEAATETTPIAIPEVSTSALAVSATLGDLQTKASEPILRTAVDASAAAQPATAPWTKASTAVAIYAAGVLLLALRLAHGRFTLHRLVQGSAEVQDPSWRTLLRECETSIGISQPVRLLRSLDRSMPMAFGLRTPTILIPAIADTWSEDRRRAVLLHELAHIDRRDCMTQLLAEVACAAYWMHPAVWLVAQRLRVERELACDDRVLAVGTAARDYATHLLELAYSLGGYRSPALVVSMARPRQLEGRMLAVLDAARNRVTPPRLAGVAGLVATAALVVPLAAAEAVMISDSSEAPRMTEWATRSATTSSTTPEGTLQPPPPPPPAPPARRERPQREIQLPGTWELRASDDAGKIYLQVSDRRGSQHGFNINLDQLEGLSPSLLSGAGGPVKFNMKRDAGTIGFDGVFRSGVGAGTFDFTPNQSFPAEMVKRGFESPNATEQYQLARGNIGFAYLDELNAQKYARPTLAELVRAADHGVHLEYLRGMGAAGYHLGQIDALIRTRDHGVTPAYVTGMANEGFKNLTADELVRARDHGVTPEYVGTMRGFGYKNLALNEVVRARDHGVDADYIRGMATLGHDRLSLEEMIRARDHGVGPDYIKGMREAGFGPLPINELVNARDHGVSPEFAREMREAGYGTLPLGDLINARDHGVNGDYAKGMREAGYGPLPLDELVNARDHGVGADFAKAFRDLGYKVPLTELVRTRDHGVGAEFAREMNSLGYQRLPLEDLVRLRDHGVTASFVRDQNSRSTVRLTVEQLVRRRNGQF